MADISVLNLGTGSNLNIKDSSARSSISSLSSGKLDKPTKYTQTLAAGSTSVTFTGVSTTSNSKLDVYTSQVGLDYTGISVSGTSVTVSYEAQSSAVTVYLIKTEV